MTGERAGELRRGCMLKEFEIRILMVEMAILGVGGFGMVCIDIFGDVRGYSIQ